MSKWTDEEALVAVVSTMPPDDVEDGCTGPRARLVSLLENLDGTEYSGNVALARACASAAGRALLDARERAEKAEAINAELRQQATASRENASNLAVQLGDARKQVATLTLRVAVLEAVVRNMRPKPGANVTVDSDECLRALLVEAAYDGVLCIGAGGDDVDHQQAEAIADRILKGGGQ